MPWTVQIGEDAIGDAEWFGQKNGRQLLKTAIQRLSINPTSETRHMKTLRPNPVAQRELRLLGDYRILFDVDAVASVVQILVVGEKRGNALFVRGQEYIRHEADHLD
jgi:mRNA-degrading endonuclease RelE of RelBE toxin-antitoxin system